MGCPFDGDECELRKAIEPALETLTAALKELGNYGAIVIVSDNAGQHDSYGANRITEHCLPTMATAYADLRDKVIAAAARKATLN